MKPEEAKSWCAGQFHSKCRLLRLMQDLSQTYCAVSRPEGSQGRNPVSQHWLPLSCVAHSGAGQTSWECRSWCLQTCGCENVSTWKLRENECKQNQLRGFINTAFLFHKIPPRVLLHLFPTNRAFTCSCAESPAWRCQLDERDAPPSPCLSWY